MSPEAGFSASKLRLFMIVGLLAVIALLGAGYYFGNAYMESKSADLKNYISENATSVYNSASIMNMKSTIENNSGLTTKIDNLYLPAANYQSSLRSTLDTYAGLSGVKIASVTFDAVNPVNPTAKTASIKFDGTVDYISLVKFLKYLENTTPKIVISRINIGVESGIPSGQVVVTELSVEVFTK